MHHKTSIAVAAIATAVGLLSGCDVRQTQEGDVSLPKYEVEKTKEGNVTLPKVDVTAPDVNVNSKPAEVTVPKVTTEKETIRVPDVDIKTGQEKAAEKQQGASR